MTALIIRADWSLDGAATLISTRPKRVLRRRRSEQSVAVTLPLSPSGLGDPADSSPSLDCEPVRVRVYNLWYLPYGGSKKNEIYETAFVQLRML